VGHKKRGLILIHTLTHGTLNEIRTLLTVKSLEL